MKETRAIILPPNESCNGDGWSRQSHERTFRGAARLATHRFTSVMLCGSKRRALRLPRKRLAGGTAKIRVGRAVGPAVEVSAKLKEIAAPDLTWRGDCVATFVPNVRAYT